VPIIERIFTDEDLAHIWQQLAPSDIINELPYWYRQALKTGSPMFYTLSVKYREALLYLQLVLYHICFR
jgi:hypothetical protein